ncbi:salivary glue protein Sgs-3 [Drosophila suzukii]|uniref:Salivary glue protein Sgs-3 n=1 Tax=Drosophila suzukii TaxID=28584 RepID=A0AB39ZKJ6_DROSZ
MKLTLICLLVSFVLLQYVEHSEASLEVIERALGLEPRKEGARKEHQKSTHKEPHRSGPGLVRTTRKRVTLRPRHRVTRRIKRHTRKHHRTTRSIPVPPREHTTHRTCTEPTNPPCNDKTTHKSCTEPTKLPCTEKTTPPCSEITTEPITESTNPPCTEKTTTTPTTTEKPSGCKSSHPPGWNPGGPIQTSPPRITKEPCGCNPRHPPGWNPGGPIRTTPSTNTRKPCGCGSGNPPGRNPGGPKIPIPNIPGHFGPGPVIPNRGGKECGCPNECPPKEELSEDLRIIQDKIQLLLDECILQSQSC